jgi:hypothetical protein
VVVARSVDSPTSATSPGAELRGELAALRADLEAERRARRALAEEVAALRGDLLRATAPPARAPAPPPAAPPPEADPEPTHPASGAEARADAADEANTRFDPDALRAAGVADFEIDELRERWEQYELAKLEIDDLALRGGWSGRPRHRRQLRALDAGLRTNLGEDGYDAFLYATGRENRLVVEKLLSASKATASGLQPGDVVWSYDGARIFHAHELARIAAAGQPGEYVRMQVLRDGRRISLGLERGPVAAIFDPASRPPTGR